MASTAGIGFTFDPQYSSGGALLDAMSPVLNDLQKAEPPGFDIEKLDQFNLTFSTNEGFQYQLSEKSTYVEYVYRIQVAHKSGAPPEAKMLTQIIPYSKQLDEISTRLIKAAQLTPESKKRKILRIGVLSITNAAPEELPPGIKRFIEYLARPWGGELFSTQFRLATNLPSSGAAFKDRCIHTLAQSGKIDEPMNIRLDFQRTFVTGRRIEAKGMSEIVDETTRAADRYFEELAEGNLFDEDILRTTA